MLVIDEADRILEIGFEEDMRAIIKFLPKKGRQTALFSATQTQNVAALARLAIEHKPVYVAAQQSAENSTVSTLEQGFVVCEASHRFMLLFTFLKKNLKKKACPLQACACSTRVYTLRVRCVCTACALHVHWVCTGCALLLTSALSPYQVFSPATPPHMHRAAGDRVLLLV